MKKMLIPIKHLFILVFVLIVATGCFNDNKGSELKMGRYVIQEAETENSAWVLLKEDNKFEFNRSLITSYRPLGSYSIESNVLNLIVNENEIYTFTIDGDKLIYKGSNTGSSIVKEGTVFNFSNKN